MEYLTAQFNRITNWFLKPTNLELVGHYHVKPKTHISNESHIAAHKVTLEKAFSRYLYSDEIDKIVYHHRRSDATEEAILTDFFANDVDAHIIPFDEHTLAGLECMADAFRPPNKCRPCHINDVEHHYPYKWQVNAEPPFSTDEYFLRNRPTYRDFYDSEAKSFTKYVNPVDLNRRLTTEPSEDTLKQQTPAKFGFMKSAIFNWTRRWHHYIKDGFTEPNMDDDYYYTHRYIFPMLLHTKTAIVKKDDPDKMRTIWGASKPWIIADTMFYWEYVAWLKLNPGVGPMLWGYETFTGGWFRLNAVLFSSVMRSSFLTLDWSRFDKRAYFTLIKMIMLKVRDFLDFDNGYVPNVDYPTTDGWTPEKAKRLQRLWEWTLECIFKSAIVLPDGRMYVRHFAGIPSGLYITQLLDSWYNYTMIATILHRMGFNPKSCIIKVQGDDSIVRLNVLIPPSAHEDFLLCFQELSDYYFKSVISVTKSEIRNQLNGCEVLSYRHHNGIPFRDEILMLAQFYHTKARSPTPEITMAQAIGFAYASCGNHKRVYWVLKDIHDYYKDKGFTPNPAGITLTFGDSPDLPTFPFTLEHFPTLSECREYLTCTAYENEATTAKTWPMSYFLSLPAQ